MKFFKILSLVSTFILLFTVLPSISQAYVLNSNKISDPKDAYYWIDPAFSKYSGLKAEVKTGITSWNPTPEIQFTKEASAPGGGNVKIEYIDQYSGNTYAVSRGKGNITVYKKWRAELNSTRRKETISHEVGHELGLAHTQSKNNSISVMRQLGFNDKPYPLSDDKAGIKAKY
ncbi:M12 family metallopeptidase [Cytobacillus horneckiae]|uniref:M12 family metallopeptidase n=1 Tax=Cytobacillus horneckiae TaxID=549687 RepID=UPI0039A3C163